MSLFHQLGDSQLKINQLFYSSNLSIISFLGHRIGRQIAINEFFITTP